MKENLKHFAFTLTEVMIVLAVIGIISAIIMPVAIDSMPNKKVLKFKKAHIALSNTIKTILNSDNYYCEGDLGLKPDCITLIDGTHPGDKSYLCNSFASIIRKKSENCVESGNLSDQYIDERSNYANLGVFLDCQCAQEQDNVNGQKIVASDGTTFYFLSTKYPFGISTNDFWALNNETCLSNNSPEYCNGRMYSGHSNVNNLNSSIVYATLCIDIDGFSANSEYTSGCNFGMSSPKPDSCGNECPFGYAIRVDGKIIPGARAQEWLDKDVHDDDD